MTSVRRRRRLSSIWPRRTAGRASPALRGDHEPVPGQVERRPDRALARARRVQVGGVDVGEARVDRRAYELDVLRRLLEAVGPHPDPPDLDVAEPDRRLRHRLGSTPSPWGARPAGAGALPPP